MYVMSHVFSPPDENPRNTFKQNVILNINNDHNHSIFKILLIFWNLIL